MVRKMEFEPATWGTRGIGFIAEKKSRFTWISHRATQDTEKA